MLGSKAEGIHWMFRQLERSENTARLLEVGLRMSLMSATTRESEWASVLTTAGLEESYRATGHDYAIEPISEFMLRCRDNPSSVRSLYDAARANGRRVRTALTREVWEATNDASRTIAEILAEPVRRADLFCVLSAIRRESAYVRGAFHGTMLRRPTYNFARLGTFIERADNTARILDVKYYMLLPSVAHVGSLIDTMQWENILRSVSAHRAYRWTHDDGLSAAGIAAFLILDGRVPRSLAYCTNKMRANLEMLELTYEARAPSGRLAEVLTTSCSDRTIDDIFEVGLHEFLVEFIGRNAELAGQLQTDYRFVP